MVSVVSKFTVFFSDPFWIGVYERYADGNYEVCKITFGTEPRDQEVFNFLLKEEKFLRFSPSLITANLKGEKRLNPKRVQRQIHKQLLDTGLGTKAQQALKLQHEQNKQIHKARYRTKQKSETDLKFLLHQKKKKEKHKGH